MIRANREDVQITGNFFDILSEICHIIVRIRIQMRKDRFFSGESMLKKCVNFALSDDAIFGTVDEIKQRAYKDADSTAEEILRHILEDEE